MKSFAFKLVLVFATTFLIAMSAINARATYGAKISVDEPQYLLTALSIAEDFDLDISDELDQQRYLPFHELRLNQQTIDLNDQGQRISPHDPLLPLLLAAPMGLGGWLAAKMTLAAIAALTAMATLWVAVRRFQVSENLAAVSAFVDACFHQKPDAEIKAKAVGYNMLVPPKVRMASRLRQEDRRAVAERTKKPCWVAWGDHERLAPSDMGEQILKHFPNSKRQTFKQSGHSPFWEEAEKFNLNLASFANVCFANLMEPL